MGAAGAAGWCCMRPYRVLQENGGNGIKMWYNKECTFTCPFAARPALVGQADKPTHLHEDTAYEHGHVRTGIALQAHR